MISVFRAIIIFSFITSLYVSTGRVIDFGNHCVGSVGCNIQKTSRTTTFALASVCKIDVSYYSFRRFIFCPQLSANKTYDVFM